MGEIGEALKKRRAEKGLTLSQVEEETKIRSRYLEALEEEQFNVIPGRVYVKGFLRTYGTFLGLNALELLTEYEKLNSEVKIKPEETTITRTQQRKKREASKVSFQWNPKWNKFLALMGAVILLVLMNKFYPWGGSDTARRDPAPTNNKVQEETKTPNQQSPKETANNENKQAEVQKPEVQKPKGVNLELALKDGDSWMQVRADGNTIFEGIAKEGETKSFTGQEKVFVKLGNAGAVEITLNGESIGKIGKLGTVVSKEFVIDQLNVVE